ncbi:GNAT family N-acetyltransferase, partial [Streptococcus pneumoniae]|nr:GNAT family N-acetyltransferase [Streptococcus pneumoniae]
KMGFTFDGQEKILELGKPIKEKRMVFYSKIILKSRS